jgi:alcohol dehydrogenase, propanol-preferring
VGGMRAWVVDRPGPVATGPLRLVERPVPEPRPGELLVRVICCGVCRTDLHLAVGDLPPKAPRVTPGHEVVGEVVATGPGPTRFHTGDRVVVA